MKILLFAPYYPPVIGGQEYHERELAKVLQKNGVEVELLTRYKKPKLLTKLSTFFFYFTSFFKLFFKKYDLIYGYDVHAGTVMLMFKIFSRRPTVLIIVSSVFLKNFDKNKWLYRMMLRRQDAIINDSEEIDAKCRQLRQEGVYNIPNGVDSERFRPEKNDFLRKQYNIAADKKIIITVRRLVEKNNVIELAKAFDSVAKKINSCLVIVGDGGQRQAIEQLGNKDIIITGFKPNEEIPNYLNSADFFAIPSLMEATSISCLEAMACGLPIVATRVGGLPEIVKDGENGYLCEPTASSIADAILKIFKADAKKMGTRSREIAEMYSWDNFVKQYIEIFESVAIKRK